MTVARADFAARVKRLPGSYQRIWAELDEEIQRYSDLTGRNLIPIMSSLLEFLKKQHLIMKMFQLSLVRIRKLLLRSCSINGVPSPINPTETNAASNLIEM